MMKMARFGLVGLTFIMLMIVGMVKGRWLELDTFSPSMISDGVQSMGDENPSNILMGASNSSVPSTMLYADKRCNSLYGFLPCGDTMQEGVFLMLMYTYLMMLGEEWIHKGSEVLFLLLGDKAINLGASIFRVLMAMPRIIIVIVSGVLSTSSDAQNQVAFGVSMYAGSTVITLTLIWGLHIILCRDMLRGKESSQNYEHQNDAPTKSLSVRPKLSALTDTGVDIDEATGQIAILMLLSLIPFAIVELVALVNNAHIPLFALIVSAVSLLSYFAYQIGDPWIQVRSLAYLKEENLRDRFFYHIQRLAKDKLFDNQGNLNFVAIERIFKEADKNGDGWISHQELEDLIQKLFEWEKEIINKEYAKAEILTNFDDDKSEKISLLEFKKGCTKWLEKWKNDENRSNSVSDSIWEQARKVAIKRKRSKLTRIEIIMPRILKQVVEKYELMKEDGEHDREKIEGLFSIYDKDKDGKIHQSELRTFIGTLQFGLSLDHKTVWDEVLNDFKIDKNHLIEKKQFVEGFVKWIRNAITHDPTIKDPKRAIDKFEENTWGEIDAPMQMNESKANILYVIFGVGIMYLISGAYMQSVIQFSDAAHIPFLFTSFVMAPIAMNARTVVTAIINSGSGVHKNASLAFSEIYNGLIMNNLLGLFTLLMTIYIKGLSWTYSGEVITVMIPCAVVGLFVFNRDTYPLWASISAMLLYPLCVYAYYLLDF